MSGVAGADRIKSRNDFKQFLASYQKLIAKFPGFVSMNTSGSYNSDPSKNDFGDIDLIVHIKSDKDKPTVKKELQAFLQAQPDTVIVPFTSEKHAGKRSYNAGELVSVRYHDDQLGYSAQIDNIVALDESEASFKQQFLDLPAEKQGLILGLVKIATIETDPQRLFKSLGITAPVLTQPNEEYEFNLSSVELQLRKVTYKPGTYEQIGREVIWTSRNFDDLKKVLYQYNLDADFDTLLARSKQVIKNPRSNARMQGVFSSMITVKSGEVGTAKGAGKEAALGKIQQTFREDVFKWTDYENIDNMDDRLHLAETYFTTNDNLFESNESHATNYFLSLRSDANNPEKNKKYITVLLGLVGNRIIKMQPIEFGTFIKKQNDIFYIQYDNGQIAKFPSESTQTKLIAKTFLFDTVPSYDKFRSEIMMKFNTSLPPVNENHKDYSSKIKESRLLREMIKPQANTVVFAFGRFQPPTIGHELLINTVKNTAAGKSADYVIYASKTQDSKTNPLSINQKMHYLNLAFPGTNFAAANAEVRTFIEAAKILNNRYKNLIMVAGSDRVQAFEETLNKYNGTEYNYDTIKVVSAGERDPDSDSAAGMSATKMREAAVAGDLKLFMSGLPKTIGTKDAEQLMKDIQQGLVKQPKTNMKAKEITPVAEGNEMSDAAQARELIGRAMSNRNERQKYFDFIKFLIKKNGKDYGIQVHQLATKLAKEGQDGMAGVGMGNYIVDKSTTNEHIVKHGSGYRLVSKKTGKNLGDFPTRAAAEKHEREVQYFKHAGESVETDEAAAWQKSSGKNKNGGLNKKGVASYRREHPGSKLKTAVTKKPSELKAGSKDAKRRKSFCARMKGMKKHNTSSKTAHDPDSRINKSLRKWHCESIEEMAQMIENAERFLAEAKVEEKWTKKYKDSINCSNPKGFSQKAHCAGKKKNEETEMEEAKQRLDPKCWKGYKKQGTKMKGNTRVNNCVPVDESVETTIAKLIKLLESK